MEGRAETEAWNQRRKRKKQTDANKLHNEWKWDEGAGGGEMALHR